MNSLLKPAIEPMKARPPTSGRHEYVVDLLGGASGLNYACDYGEFSGINVPTTHRAVAFDENKRKIPNPALVAIDIRGLAFE